MAFTQLGAVGLGHEAGVGSPRGNGQYVNLGSNNHGTLLLASNLYMDDDNDNLKIANDHPTISGAAIQIPGNNQSRQNHIEFWISPSGNVNQGQNFGNTENLRVIITPEGFVGIGTSDPAAALHITPHPSRITEQIRIEAADPESELTAFTRLNATTHNGRRESQLYFGGELNFVWMPSVDAGGDAENVLRLLVATDGEGNVTANTARFYSDVVLRNRTDVDTIRLDRENGRVGVMKQSPDAPVHIGPSLDNDGNEEVWIDAVDPENPNLTAFTRLRAATSNGKRESQLLFGGECHFVWLPSSGATGGGDAKSVLTLFVNPDDRDRRAATFFADVVVHNRAGNETIRLDRENGDIILQNADCAEDFDVADCTNTEPGSVMVLGDDGQLHLSTQAYDRRVAGVVSGAGPYRPGLVLDRQQDTRDRQPIALVGKTYCKVDASLTPIRVGDLLTTADTPGFAMAATDPIRAFGAVLGKALRSLDFGRGMIPILVTLQ